MAGNYHSYTLIVTHFHGYTVIAEVIVEISLCQNAFAACSFNLLDKHDKHIDIDQANRDQTSL